MGWGWQLAGGWDSDGVDNWDGDGDGDDSGDGTANLMGQSFAFGTVLLWRWRCTGLIMSGLAERGVHLGHEPGVLCHHSCLRQQKITVLNNK